jgi:hypothetical protein
MDILTAGTVVTTGAIFKKRTATVIRGNEADEWNPAGGGPVDIQFIPARRGFPLTDVITMDPRDLIVA